MRAVADGVRPGAPDPDTPGRLAFDHVHKAFPGRRGARPAVAVRDLDLRMRAGEFLCLLGPSGCGKSTVLNLAAGFSTPTSGRVLLDGRPIDGPGAERGVVFQQYALFPWYTVEQNVGLGPKVGGVPGPERASLVRDMLTRVGLWEHRHKYPRELSGGMSQRAAIARTLVNRPRVVLMDEPFAALDARTRHQMQNDLLDLWQVHRTTALFVTHSVEEAVLLADRIIVLSGAPRFRAEVVEIALPRPREVLSAEFLEVHRAVHDLVEAAAATHEAPAGVAS